MSLKNLLRPIVYELGLKKAPKPMTKVEQWRANGVTIGENFDGPDSIIDFCCRYHKRYITARNQRSLRTVR